MEPQIPLTAYVLFIVLVFGLLTLILFGYRSVLIKSGTDDATRKRKVRMVALPLLFWLFFLSKISGMHFFHDWSVMPPRIMIAVLPPLIISLMFVFSKRLNPIIDLIPQHWLIGIQSFRIIMEIILLMLFLDNIIPVQMTFEGKNFDILSGLTAIPVAYYAFRNKLSQRFILGWNIFGLILLVNIVVIAILSTPLPVRVFMNEPANTVIAYFPFVWLPGFVVPVAYVMHFISIRKCLTSKNK
jgi:hypothetical protein